MVSRLIAFHMEITIKSLSEIHSAAKIFIENIGDNRLFAFYGSMGVGKTTFIKAVCEELGVTDDVASPTFAIVNEYKAGNLDCKLSALSHRPIYHFDFYRIKRPEEIFDIGFEEYADSGDLCFMEWPELVEQFLPRDTVNVTIKEVDDGMRSLSLSLPK